MYCYTSVATCEAQDWRGKKRTSLVYSTVRSVPVVHLYCAKPLFRYACCGSSASRLCQLVYPLFRSVPVVHLDCANWSILSLGLCLLCIYTVPTLSLGLCLLCI